ncbi:MAG: DUF881 domain-containing protein [Angustibacter sp.]
MLSEPRTATAPGRTSGAWAVVVPLVFALAGFIAVTSSRTARGTDLRSDGRTSTADLIRQQQHRAEQQERRVAELRQDVQDQARRAAPAGSELQRIQRETSRLAEAAGTTAVRGPALRVELDDAPRGARVPHDVSADDLVVHQQDVQAVVNALWSAGADAMMLMDQRVIATSAVRCVGNVLILQDRVYSPPYRITAIGDVAAMRRALEESAAVRTYRGYADLYGLGYQVQDSSQVVLPAYGGSLLLPHVRVLRDGTSETGTGPR